MRPRSWVVFPSRRPVDLLVRAVSVVLLLAGAVGLVLGGRSLIDSRRFVANAVATDAVVVDVASRVERVRRGSGDDDYEDATVFRPVVRFVTPREQEVRFQARDGSED
jgi:hypothetical protein